MADTLTQPDEALRLWLSHLRSVSTEALGLEGTAGRVLAESVHADRDSPPHDVSAMDGYAVRLADLGRERMPVAGEVMTGQRPPAIAAGTALRIFTGGCVPSGADAVIRREDVQEQDDSFLLRVDPATISAGQNIRRQGENLRQGDAVVEAGRGIDAAVAGALCAFGVAEPRVHRRVRVGVIVTGNELREVNDSVEPWEIRDSNGSALDTLLRPQPWIELVERQHVEDEPGRVTEAVAGLLPQCDCLLLTGGVSMGDHDYVPDAVRAADGKVVFHRIAIRPGKPLLAAVGPHGQAIAGLPGNPVSVLVTARVFAAAALRRLAGFAVAEPPRSVVMLDDESPRPLDLWWYRPVTLQADGTARSVPCKGSGDVVSAARGDGFVRIPPGETGRGPWPWWPWRMD